MSFGLDANLDVFGEDEINATIHRPQAHEGQHAVALIQAKAPGPNPRDALNRRAENGCGSKSAHRRNLRHPAPT